MGGAGTLSEHFAFRGFRRFTHWQLAVGLEEGTRLFSLIEEILPPYSSSIITFHLIFVETRYPNTVCVCTCMSKEIVCRFL